MSARGLIPLLILLLAPAAGYGRELEVVDKLTVKAGVEISTSSSAGALLFISSGTNPGNVGIATASPATRLHVAGTIGVTQILCPTCTNMQVRVAGSCPAGQGIQRIEQNGTVVCEIGVPNPLIVLSTSTCPSGYGELPSFYGRFLKGMPTGGTVAGTAGTASGDLVDLGHNHTFTGTADVTSSVDLAHTHTLDPPNTTSGGPTANNCRYFSSGDDGNGDDVGDLNHTHATDISGFTSAGASLSQNHNHTYTPNYTVPLAATPPYIQVRFCMKL